MLFSILLSFTLPQQEFLSDTTWQLPNLDIEVRELRWWDKDAAIIRSVATLPDGREVDVNLLRQRDFELGHASNGKLSPELLERIS